MSAKRVAKGAARVRFGSPRSPPSASRSSAAARRIKSGTVVRHRHARADRARPEGRALRRAGARDRHRGQPLVAAQADPHRPLDAFEDGGRTAAAASEGFTWVRRVRLDRHESVGRMDSLLERGAELEGLAAQLAAARAAGGSVALLEAPAGQGKTALLRVLRARAPETGLRVLSATGAPLERDFAFGIVRQLFEALSCTRPTPERRARLFAGAAALAEPVFGADAAGGDGESHSTLYGLYWLCANLAAEQPLLVVVDDAHWADAPSLRFLDALARRVEDLPVLLAIAARPAEPGAEQALLDGLATAPATVLLRPSPLSAEGVAALVRARIDASTGVRGGLLRDHGGQPAAADRAAAGGARSRAARTRPRRCARPSPAPSRGRSPRASGGSRRARWRSPARPRCWATRRASAASRRCPRCRSSRRRPSSRCWSGADLIDAAEGRFVHPMVPGRRRGRPRHRALAPAPSGGAPAGRRRRARRRRRHAPAGRRARERPVGGGRARRRGPARAGRGRAGRRAAAAAARRARRRRASCSCAAPPQFRTGSDPLATLDEAAATGDARDRRRGGPARGDRARAALRARGGRGAPARRAGGTRRRSSRASSRTSSSRRWPTATTTRPSTCGSSRRARGQRAGPTLLCHLAHARALAGATREEVLPPARRALADARVFARLGVERFAALWAIEALLAVEAAPEARRGGARDVRSRQPLGLARLGGRGGVDGGALGAALRPPAPGRGPRAARARARPAAS